MEIIDANIILRFVTRDHKRQAEKCKLLFEKKKAAKQPLYITDLTIAEVIWVLTKVYKCSKSDIRLKIESILNTANFVFQDRELLAEAVIYYDILNVDFIDAFHAVLMRRKGIEKIYSYDKDFDSFNGIERIEP